ncbi:hypothetical protein TSOC_010357 [Tetrabaena socialis]|uniref:F-box domain-containing protein n=1 Tax=Tetrabaena socialis TaxID=47790 RepID=A0A2J7ZTK0_9CHLO|nr:hypothetical protein TSOC_010357 [Tetrabaena socialis]|eukprot:PNH03578.1 hypothetical protein TSOC_010357 [Tetrabaena socialis]
MSGPLESSSRAEALEQEAARPAKRAKTTTQDDVLSQLCQSHEAGASLLSLPDGVLHHVLAQLSSPELNALGATSKYFRSLDKASGLPLTHRFAKEALVRILGDEKQAMRWRGYTWPQRLAIEETVTKFDRDQSDEKFTFKEMAGAMEGTTGVTEIKLDVPGPRILVSDQSTAESPILRWKLQLRGNNAAEFGVVPTDFTSLRDAAKALHKCHPNGSDERATGFSSAITVGSLLPARLPIMKGTIVELLVTPRELSFIITNPDDGAEMIWQNNSTISRPYKGPRELRLQLARNYTTPIKLAVTAWQRAAFDVLHTTPKAMPPTTAPAVAVPAAVAEPAAAVKQALTEAPAAALLLAPAN